MNTLYSEAIELMKCEETKQSQRNETVEAYIQQLMSNTITVISLKMATGIHR